MTKLAIASFADKAYNPFGKRIFNWYRDAGKTDHNNPAVNVGFFVSCRQGRTFFCEVLMKLKAKIMDEAALNRALMRISHEIAERNRGAENLLLIGIRRRGEPIARRICDNIAAIEGVQVPCASIDTGIFRDDLTAGHDNRETRRLSLPFDVNDKDLILVDDVLYTGRTVRAAIEAVFTCGRPRTIQLAVLVDRGHRELPIRADYVGKNIPTSRMELVKVRLPEYDEETGVFLFENNVPEIKIK